MRDKVAVVVGLTGAVAFAVLAVLLLPWSLAPDVDPALLKEFFTPEQIDRAESYSSRARAWSWSSLALSVATLLVLACSARFRRVVGRLPGPWWASVALATCLVLLIQRVITLPMAFGGWRLRVSVGLSNADLGGWLRDVTVSWCTSAAITVLLVLVVLGARRRWRRAGTAVAAGIVASAVLVGSAVYPLVIEPLSHDFAALPAGDLRDAIEDVALAQGVEVDDVVVADASRRTTALNAWVSGIGPTRRIVLYDTLLEAVPQGEVVAVVAHELAHAQQEHVLKGTVLGAAGAVAGVGLLGLLLSAGRWPLRGAGERGEEARVVAGLLLCLAVGTQLMAPVQNGMSRMVEREADLVSLETGATEEEFTELQVSLALRSLSDPTPPPLSHWWWGSHPTMLERIVSARGSGGMDSSE